MRQLTARTCDELVRLPMRGAVESLNVSVASGVCLYEAVRQRRAARRAPTRGDSKVNNAGHRGPPPARSPQVGLLREAGLSTKSFREITAELGRLLTYEATADFPLETVSVECWSGLEVMDQRQEDNGRADPARRPRHARGRPRHDPERQGERRRHRPQPRDAACPSLMSSDSPAAWRRGRRSSSTRCSPPAAR